SEEKEDEELNLFHQFIRRPSETPWPAANNSLESYYPSLAHPINLPCCQPHVNDDIFFKPVVDHLVSLFFEHCFQDFDFFSPLVFLRLYVQGVPTLFPRHGLRRRFSVLRSPHLAKYPSYTSGEPYVNCVKAKMPELVSDVSIETMHILILLTYYEYSHHPSRELPLAATTFAPPSKTITPVEIYSAIPTTADVLMPSTIPRPVTPPPSANPRPVPDADTSPQWRSDLTEYAKLDSEVKRWKT
ncbi:hypothetical protein BG015_008612, partial [Linnemannia schmuckeri]